MFRFIVLTTLVALASSQQGYHQNPRNAAIISEQRYLSGDGKFGAAYTQEDGINFKEETDADGTRHGSYSYVDPTGERRTISYTAGKNGFQASGDHLPVPPPAPPQPIPQAGYAPQPQYQPQAGPSQPSFRSNDYDDGSYDPRYNDPGYNQPQSYHQPQQQPQPQYRPPAPVQPAYNPAPTYNPPPQPQQQYNNYQQHQQQQQPDYYTTPNPHRFSPPGKLSLNRTPDGFTYSFNKV